MMVHGGKDSRGGGQLKYWMRLQLNSDDYEAGGTVQ